jgi:hypothetical protein
MARRHSRLPRRSRPAVRWPPVDLKRSCPDQLM